MDQVESSGNPHTYERSHARVVEKEGEISDGDALGKVVTHSLTHHIASNRPAGTALEKHCTLAGIICC